MPFSESCVSYDNFEKCLTDRHLCGFSVKNTVLDNSQSGATLLVNQKNQSARDGAFALLRWWEGQESSCNARGLHVGPPRDSTAQRPPQDQAGKHCHRAAK